MIRIKSIFLKLFITYIIALAVSHLILAIVYNFLLQNNLTNIHPNSGSHLLPGYLFALSSMISIVITGLFAYYFSKKLTAPLREMNRIALHMARGQFDQRVRIKTGDELGELGKTFNYMARELAGLDETRKALVANVSHDLRSPLTSIHGYVRAFLDDTIPDERKNHYFRIIKEQTERMIKLVNDLLDMAQIEAGQMEIRPVIFDLSELVRRVVARMEPEFRKKRVNIELFSKEVQDIMVFADPDRIDQVITNLLYNAIQVSSPGSHIDVTLEKGERAAVSIRDYGHGISQDDIEAIWQRFYKADPARSTKSGTGLGLSIVKHVLDLHQSPVYVESEVGNGAAFTFTLPIPVAGGLPREGRNQEQPGRHSPRNA